MKCQYLASARAYLDTSGDLLLADEVRHALPFGIAETLAQNPHTYGQADPWFLVLKDGDDICASAICTPPHQPILSHFAGETAEVATALVSAIQELTKSIPGAVGEKALIELFSGQWCSEFGAAVQSRMSQRIYKMTQLVEPGLAPGKLRNARIEEEDLIARWTMGFQAEISGEAPSHEQLERCRQRITEGCIVVWDHDGPVSMALSTRPTKNGISIGGVYTPPELRKKGYASSCVAMLCKRLLKAYDFCALYTDLSNPTSNAIYKRIGFREHCDSAQYSFKIS